MGFTFLQKMAPGDEDILSSKMKKNSHLACILEEERSLYDEGVEQESMSRDSDNSKRDENAAADNDSKIASLINTAELMKKERSTNWLREFKEWMDENLENMEGENLLVDFKSTDGNRRYNTPKKRQKSFGERSKNLSDLVQTSEDGSSSNLLESDLSFTDDACTGSNGVLTEPSNEVNVIQAHQRVHLNSFHQLSPPELGRNLQSDSFSVEEDGASSFKTNGRPSNTTNKLMESSPSFAPRAKPVSPPLYMHMAPPTMLTMCPSCERVHGGAPKAETDAASQAGASADCGRDGAQAVEARPWQAHVRRRPAQRS